MNINIHACKGIRAIADGRGETYWVDLSFNSRDGNDSICVFFDNEALAHRTANAINAATDFEAVS